MNAGEYRDIHLPMTQATARAYRLYFFDSANHIDDVAVLACANDSEAIDAARQASNRRRRELWDRDRFILSLP